LYQCDELVRKLSRRGSGSALVEYSKNLTQNLPAADDGKNGDLIFIRHFPA
jgi:hypothetical protein